MPISNLQQLFEHQLLDLHSAETQIIQALPTMIAATTHEELRTALQNHLDVTREQLNRLDKIAEKIPFKRGTEVCQGIAGIIAEGQTVLGEVDDLATKNAAIIAAVQRVEHYEMAGYITASQHARQLSYDDEAELLEETLNEEKAADTELNGLAKGRLFGMGINEAADKSN
jgi:YD repeat-containing protein